MPEIIDSADTPADDDRCTPLEGDDSGNFQPKAGGHRWSADIDLAFHSGWDLVLFLDYADPANKKDDSGWMLEMSINPDGEIVAGITSHPGYDAIGLIATTPTKFTAYSNWRAKDEIVVEDLDVDDTHDHTIHIRTTAQERATLLAALRYYQSAGQAEPDNRSDKIHDIATNGDQVISLDSNGIDALCEKINR